MFFTLDSPSGLHMGDCGLDVLGHEQIFLIWTNADVYNIIEKE
jgi:hypothetical protein